MVKKTISLVLSLALVLPVMTTVSQSNNTSIVVSADENYNMKASSKAVQLIEECEGFSEYAYWDYKQWTIGYGTYVESNTTYPNGITKAQAEQLLYNALETFEGYVNAFLKRNQIQVTQDQFDALICFTYALPSWSFKGNEDYSLSQMLINGWSNYSDKEIFDIFGLYVKAGGEVLPGLVRRRMMEASLFLYGNTNATGPLSNSSNSVAENNPTIDSTVDTPAEDSTIEEVSYVAWKVSDTDGLNLRDGYGVSSVKLTALPYNTTVYVYDTVEYQGNTWGKVDYNGFTGWCALDYCTKVDEEYVPGDANGDGKLSASDLYTIKQYLYGKVELDEDALKRIDFDGNGRINMFDYKKALNTFLYD